MKTPYELIDEKYEELRLFFSINRVRNPYEIIKEIILNYIENNHSLFVKIDGANKGVYFIEKFYIGRTSNLYKRIAYHIIEGYPKLRFGMINVNKCLKIEEIIKERKINVKLISPKENDEKKLIEKYSKKYTLTNIEFNPNVFNNNLTAKASLYNGSNEVVEEDIINNIEIPNSGNLKYLSEFINNDYVIDPVSRFAIILKNKKSKRVGIFTSKTKSLNIYTYAYGKSISTMILSDRNKYGIESFELEFLEIEEDYKPIVKKMLDDLQEKGCKIYNRQYQEKKIKK